MVIWKWEIIIIILIIKSVVLLDKLVVQTKKETRGPWALTLCLVTCQTGTSYWGDFWKCTESHQNPLKHSSVKSTICKHLILTPKPQFSSVSLSRQLFSRYQIVENQKCTEWLQTDLEHLPVKSTLYTLNTYPWAQIFIHFAVQPATFEIQGCGKIDNALIDLRMTLNTEYWPQGPNFHLFQIISIHLVINVVFI